MKILISTLLGNKSSLSMLLTPFSRATFFRRCTLWQSIAFITLGLITATKNVSAEPPSPLVQDKEVLITNEDRSILRPNVITKTVDGSLIVAGSGGNKKEAFGWVIKTDAAGSLLWRYERDYLAEDKPYEHMVLKGRGNALIGEPSYSAAVPMPDGSTYLCGVMPRPRDIPNQPNKVGMLTHLDANGKMIDEKFMPYGIFHDCIGWQNGIVIVGSTLRKNTSDGGIGFQIPKSDFWVLALDGDGNKKWETSFPTLPGDAKANWSPPESLPYKTGYAPGQTFQAADASNHDTVLLSVGKGLMFSASDNVTTEIIRLDEQGKVLAQKKINGRFGLIHPLETDTGIQAFGSFYKGNESSHALIFLDDKLELIRQVQSDSSFHFITHIAYRLPDQSLMLFGSNAARFSDSYSSGALHVDKDLKSTTRIDLEKSGYQGIGTIYAAVPAQQSNEFITASPLVTKDYARLISNKDSGFVRGAVLNFIQIK